MSEKLKPCPFCGEEAFFSKTVYKEVGVIRCQKCRATNGIITTEETATKAWNNRQGQSFPCDWENEFDNKFTENIFEEEKPALKVIKKYCYIDLKVFIRNLLMNNKKVRPERIISLYKDIKEKHGEFKTEFYRDDEKTAMAQAIHRTIGELGLL